MSCQCGDCAVCRGEKRPLFPRAAWSDPGRLKQRIEQAEASVMAEERQAQDPFKWARVGFSVALMVQVGLTTGCFPAATVDNLPSPQPSTTLTPGLKFATSYPPLPPMNLPVRSPHRPQQPSYGMPRRDSRSSKPKGH